jgi:hypothetical protein
LEVQLDDNLTNGRTYTFSFKLENLITFPSEATVRNDLDADAPDYMTSVRIVHQEIFFGKDLYHVQFTYEGDGSDVASDVADSIVSAVNQGSNDSLTFISAIAAGVASVPTQLETVANTVGTTVGQTVGTAVKDTLSGTTQGLGMWLVPIMLVLGIVILLQLGGASGIRRSLA